METEIGCAAGDRVRMRKPHACGADTWKVIRTGMDVGIKCEGCGRYVLLPRRQFRRQMKERVVSIAEGAEQ